MDSTILPILDVSLNLEMTIKCTNVNLQYTQALKGMRGMGWIGIRALWNLFYFFFNVFNFNNQKECLINCLFIKFIKEITIIVHYEMYFIFSVILCCLFEFFENKCMEI